MNIIKILYLKFKKNIIIDFYNLFFLSISNSLFKKFWNLLGKKIKKKFKY